MRMVFVNLAVDDVSAARRFWTALGFEFDERWSDDNCACLVLSDSTFGMLLERSFFSTFVEGEVADARRTTEVLTCLSASSREEVDRLVAGAVAAGGKPWKASFDMGPMYGGSFQDPDGHVWEVLHTSEPPGPATA